MDSFEINKIIAAILMVALLIIGLGKISDIIFYVEKPETPSYSVEAEQVINVSSATTEEKTENLVDIPLANLPDNMMRPDKKSLNDLLSKFRL